MSLVELYEIGLPGCIKAGSTKPVIAVFVFHIIFKLSTETITELLDINY